MYHNKNTMSEHYAPCLFQAASKYASAFSIYYACVIAILLTLDYPGHAEEVDHFQIENKIIIVSPDSNDSPIGLAVSALCRDFNKVMGIIPEVTKSIPSKPESPILVIINRSDNKLGMDIKGLKSPKGWEAHRIWAELKNRTIYLDGADMRGTIFAIYSFSEKFLGVPPLWYWTSWIPDKKNLITIDVRHEFQYDSPQVRYRAWFPNDTDLFAPWINQSESNNDNWLETMLRLKLNTVEYGNTQAFPGMTPRANQLLRFGMVLTSHHMIAMNASLANWGDYWKRIRKLDNPPELSLKNENLIIEFWRYCAQEVVDSGIENLWGIAFRGDKDKPFWATFKDAPRDDAARGAVITHMLSKQIEIINEVSKSNDPFVRITLYDEMADLFSSGHIQLPKNSKMIWTFVAGRRDHYPYDDIQQFDSNNMISIGYYFNFQFTSTGAHLAPAEGPWKMEFNYRYVNKKSPLCLSVVNAGNLREFLFELSANAKMMWDFTNYNSDNFSRLYASQYYGEQFSDKIASLYREYYNAFWMQKSSDFPGGMPRQYIFQDLRHAAAMRQILKRFDHFNPNPLNDIGYERVPGRTFHISPVDNGAENVIDAIICGMGKSAPKFESIAKMASDVCCQLSENRRRFFRDNLLAHCQFMNHLSRSLGSLAIAYKEQGDKQAKISHLEISLSEIRSARYSLLSSQEGVFNDWYKTDAVFDMEEIIKLLSHQIAREKTFSHSK